MTIYLTIHQPIYKFHRLTMLGKHISLNMLGTVYITTSNRALKLDYSTI